MDYIFILLSIIVINLLLSGDNALVIALACRQLSREMQEKVIFWGSAGAIILRVILTFVVVFVLQIPFLQFIGGLLLLWIAVKLAVGEEEHKKLAPAHNVLGAIKTIIIADLVMSIDNVIAIVAVAKGNIWLLILGLGISIPIIIWGSTVIVRMMEKWPMIVTVGAGFLGWTAGEMMVSDGKMKIILQNYLLAGWALPVMGAMIVVILGLLGKKKKS